MRCRRWCRAALSPSEGGGVIEEGDHRSLVGRGGRYAELYAMQAERYGA